MGKAEKASCLEDMFPTPVIIVIWQKSKMEAVGVGAVLLFPQKIITRRVHSVVEEGVQKNLDQH